ncbi:WD40-like repeat protein [Ignavibacterium album JCM 16511]|uniref:WD40-like repeat protein n=1 Tax=Ignavibacterium album (strain DSM 19864 / JCM 16511 / NBRC 101810 / Mat9-16) TaxID=945713 RepID=I0AKC7_IGNAJ|nr:PQQ-binding-like beta-propeller repeat protein [Ignavibacterium album]AFH49434.1 WD40-like repeat protein [Ignavibacterium album JCM 16511]
MTLNNFSRDCSISFSSDGTFEKIYFIISVLLLAGCAKSLIQISSNKSETFHPMFGKNSQRNFYYDVYSSDSLKLLWTADAFGSFNNSSVVASDSMIFIGDLAGRVHVFNLENGKQRGVLKTKGAIFSTPLLYKFRIYYPLVKDGKQLTEFIVYDFFAGKDLYIIEIEDLITNQMLSDNDAIYLFAEDGTIYKYNYEAKLIWSVETNQNLHFVPAMKNGKIFLGNDAGEFIVIDSRNGKILHREKLAKSIFSGASIDNNLCYFGDDEGNLFAMDIDSYKIKFKVKTDGRILMNPSVDERNIYLGNMKRMFYCIDKNDGKIIWSKKMKGYFNSTPVVTKNRLFVPNLFKSLLIVDKSNGELLKEVEFDNRAKLSPVIINNKIIIGYDEGVIAAYEFVN